MSRSGRPIRREVWEEDRKVRYLRLLVDVTLSMIARGNLSREEALGAFGGVRRVALRFFPDKAETFDLIYRPRFERLLDEVYE